jgi:two-component system, NtrC family, sensor histidine kinase KinB
VEQPRRLWRDRRELNRLAVRLRDLRDSEAGRRQMEFQLSDAVLQSIFEPIIVTDGKGHVLKVNQAAASCWAKRPRPHGAGQYPRRRQDSERHSRCRLDAEGGGRRGRSAMLPMRIGKQERSYRLRTTPMRDSKGGCWAP